jgi:hypothetical protein
MRNDTADLADELERFIRRYVAFADADQPVAVALWILHAWSFASWWISPRLAVQSAEMGSGKTRLLEVIELVTPGSLRPANISPAAFFRVIEKGNVTLLIDEIDTVFNPQANGAAEDLRGLLISGYRKGATVMRVDGDGKNRDVKAFPVFAPVCTAGIGELPPTLRDRSIPIRLRRRAPHEKVERFRFVEATNRGAELAQWAQDWADRMGDDLERAEPIYLAELGDRQADSWTPLLAIAEAAEGEWPARARSAALALSGTTRESSEITIGVQLLADIRDVLEGQPRNISTADLLAGLHKLEEAPWADWYGRPFGARDLAKKLKAFDIRSRDVRFDEGSKSSAKGYHRDDFADAWTRYLPPLTKGDKGYMGDNPSVPTQEMSPLSPMSPTSEGPEGEHPGVLLALQRADDVRRRRAAARR